MKRSNGEGCPQYNKKRNRFEYYISYHDSSENKTKRKVFTSKKSAKDAMKKATAFNKLIKENVDIVKSQQTLGEWLQHWLTNYKQPEIRIKTYERYALAINKHIVPYIGNMPLNSLTTDNLQQHLMFLLKFGGESEKGLAPRTVNATRRVLIQSLNDAIDLGYIPKNPADKTKTVKAPKPEILILSHEQALELIVAAKAHSMISFLAIVLALGTGMRLGEIFGLTWDNINLSKNVIHIMQSAVKTNHGTVIQKDLKTNGSRRTIPIPEFVVKTLKEYKYWQDTFYKVINSSTYIDNNFVFANQYGDVRHPASFSYHYFKKVVQTVSSLPPTLRFHDLRHCHATWLLSSGVNVKVVSERLGQASIRITLDTYAHAIKGMQDTAINALDGYKLLSTPVTIANQTPHYSVPTLLNTVIENASENS